MKDGGSAFPVDGVHAFREQPTLYQKGMTMRQYYKAAALQGLLAYYGGAVSDEHRLSVAPTIATDAAAYADAMIAEDEQFEQK